MHTVISEEFEVMHEMLSEIEIKILGVNPDKQFRFIKFMKETIYLAWEDACNPDDPFLFNKEQ